MPEVHLARAAYFSARGRHDEAIAAGARARELAPESLLVKADVAWYLLLARRYEEAVREARSTLAVEPGNRAAHTTLLWASLGRGDDATALIHASALRNAVDPVHARPLAAMTEYWRWLVARSRPAVEHSSGLLPLAVALAALGEREEALDLLLQACRERRGGYLLPFVAVDPRFDTLRSHPGYAAVNRCVGSPADPATGAGPR
jgi:tetratricopeptide (TPR) repeat protein